MTTATSPDLLAELRALTAGCGLLDRSERGKLAVSGTEAAAFLQGQVSNDIEALTPGCGCYAAFLTHKGKMLGDLRVLRTNDELELDCERVALQDLFNLLRRTMLGRDAELHKRTVQRGLFSLIGPAAREVADASAAGLEAREHDHVEASLAGVRVRLIATDSEGVDVLCDSADSAAVASALAAAGAEPVSEAASEILRVERGRPRYGAELDDRTIPQEAGLNERAVSFSKGCYVGQETVARLHYRGKPNRHLRGVKLEGPASSGDELKLGGKLVGHLATVADSPTFGLIALALVRREAGPGDALAVGEASVRGVVVGLPFG